MGKETETSSYTRPSENVARRMVSVVITTLLAHFYSYSAHREKTRYAQTDRRTHPLIWEKRFWYLSFTRSLGVNKDESKSGLTVLRLKLNQGIKEAITLRKEVSFCFTSCSGY